MSLDELLRQTAKRGELNYVSIIPKAGAGGLVFCASYRGATEGVNGMAENKDPAEAIKAAIASAKKTRRPKIEPDPDFG